MHLLGPSRCARRPRRFGFSLLEMVAATAIVAAIIVPALSVMRDAMAKSRDLNRRKLLANYAVKILEDQTAIVAANWANGSATGDFAVDGHSHVRYSVTKSDASLNGGIVNRLMHVQVTVFDDANQNGSLDTGELRVDYRTKVAKLNNYENEAL